VARGGGAPVYLVDLPGYGFARGGPNEFAELIAAYFGFEGRDGPARRGALLVVDARHPGLPQDIEAWRWLRSTVERAAIVATKIDKLSRAERLRAIRSNEAVFEHPVLPVSAVTGEGLDELWKLIDRLVSSSHPPRSSKPPNRTAAADKDNPRHQRPKS
jgi:GTP-binding protein